MIQRISRLASSPCSSSRRPPRSRRRTRPPPTSTPATRSKASPSSASPRRRSARRSATTCRSSSATSTIPTPPRHLAHRLRQGAARVHRSRVKVKRGEQHDSVKVVFEAERIRERSFNVTLAPFLYSTKDGFSGALVPGVETHHNYFSVGVVSSADELLERNSGVMLRYEHRKVGTSMVQVGVEYDYFWPSFEDEIESRPGAGPMGARHVRHAGGLLALDLVPADPGHQAHLRRQLPDARDGAPDPARRGGARVHVRRAVPAQGGVAPRLPPLDRRRLPRARGDGRRSRATSSTPGSS